MKRALCALAIVASVALLEGGASAHTPDLATARVTHRDGNVEVVVEVDVVDLVTRTVPRAGDATAIATADDRALEAYVDETRRAMQAGASLASDGRSVPLVLRAFPTSTQVRFAAAEASGAPGKHGGTSALRFETKASVGSPRELAVTLPPSLGRILYTYVQPETQLRPPGAPASFVVLAPPSGETQGAPVARVEDRGRTWLALAAGLFAIAALALQWRRRAPDAAAGTEKPT